MDVPFEPYMSVYSKACCLGYPFRWGEGRRSKDGGVWLTRFQRTNQPNDPDAIFLGFHPVKQYWVKETP